MKLRVSFDINDITIDDLYQVSFRKKLFEIVLSIPAFLLTIPCLYSELFFVNSGIVLIAAFYFYLAGLRQAHGAFHYSLGYSRSSVDIIEEDFRAILTSKIRTGKATYE